MATATEPIELIKSRIDQISVYADGTNSVRYQNMVNVFDALQRADVTRVGLATEFPATALKQIPTDN